VLVLLAAHAVLCRAAFGASISQQGQSGFPCIFRGFYQYFGEPGSRKIPVATNEPETDRWRHGSCLPPKQESDPSHLTLG
jgi:hypothetical protein